MNIFVDPVLRAPVLGSMLMCIASSLIGVLVYVRRRSLIGEALSHAAYPGVALSVLLLALFFPYSEEKIAAAVLIGAFISSLLGLKMLQWMIRKRGVSEDSALCFILATFLGVGVLIASYMQISHGLFYRQIQVFLYGQVATMRDSHMILYASLALTTTVITLLTFHMIKALHFDHAFAFSLGLPLNFIEGLSLVLRVAAIVIGIRTVGVVLMSGMLIAPAISARAFTKKLSSMLILAVIFGVLSAFIGNILSLKVPFPVPTGPAILLAAAGLAFLSLLFAPDRGLAFRFIRMQLFGFRCACENALKSAWKKEGHVMCKKPFLLLSLMRHGLIKREGRRFVLTKRGGCRAKRIVRLHRLWEVYLFDYLGVSAEDVHRSAEEMEHIITPELEKKLTKMLSDPELDPHKQPIPKLC